MCIAPSDCQERRWNIAMPFAAGWATTGKNKIGPDLGHDHLQDAHLIPIKMRYQRTALPKVKALKTTPRGLMIQTLARPYSTKIGTRAGAGMPVSRVA